MKAESLKWYEKYNNHTAVVTGGITLHVNWSLDSTRHYEVCVLGRQLKHDFNDLDEAKAAAVRLARKIANEILEVLGE